ncbi:MAG: hypothetical protein KTR27_03905 [Leptolyngbyaceae cyanobacterium MAG.088]|nr:hypothetical protein [Leptolyngbyaceae cyanobacterium MAG.088]
MHPINVLPNVDLQPGDPIADQCLQQGLTTFHEACHWVKALPYGANSSSEDSVVLFEEGCGNCTTKHGAIARLALAHNLPVAKHLGFYRLNDDIVTGVTAILQPHGLDFIPQSHCFLAYKDYRVDLTEGNCNGKNKTIDDYDFVAQVAPDLSEKQHRAIYLDHLRRYYNIDPQLATLGEDKIFELLISCDRQLKYQCSIMASSLANAAS